MATTTVRISLVAIITNDEEGWELTLSDIQRTEVAE
tara:strand:+ start:3930 stop:4037 length:108 start_codon:yes stop_codon:yes gene_type:complete